MSCSSSSDLNVHCLSVYPSTLGNYIWYSFCLQLDSIAWLVAYIACLTAGPGIANSNPALPHNFVEIGHESVSIAIFPFELIKKGQSSVTEKIQSTLVILNSKGLSEIIRDIRTSTYRICRIEEKKMIRTITFNKCMCNWTLKS